jgi:hypothetical protein
MLTWCRATVKSMFVSGNIGSCGDNDEIMRIKEMMIRFLSKIYLDIYAWSQEILLL